jgi:hypothetical protein
MDKKENWEKSDKKIEFFRKFLDLRVFNSISLSKLAIAMLLLVVMAFAVSGAGIIAKGTNLDVSGDAYVGGSFGIGTVNPTEKLEVYNGRMKIGHDNVKVGVINSETDLYFNIDSDNDGGDIKKFVFGANRPDNSGGTTILYMNELGNVGIGTVIPKNTLDIENRLTFWTAPAGWALIQDNLYFDGSDYRNIATGGGSNILLGGSDPGEGIHFRTAPSGTADAVAPVSTRMAILPNGNVGIGTANPSALVHTAISSTSNSFFNDVYSTADNHVASFNLRKSASATIGTASQTADGESLGRISAWGVTSGNTFNDDPVQIHFIQDGASGSLRVPGRMEFHTSDGNGPATAKMTLKNNGRVGIGTVNPEKKLHITDDIAIETTENANLWLASDVTSNTEDGWRINGELSPNTKFQIIEYTSGVAAERLTIDDNGNVGIRLIPDPSIGDPNNDIMFQAKGRIGFTGEGDTSGTALCWSDAATNVIGRCVSLMKYKENIDDLGIGLEDVLKLQPREFNWKDSSMGGHDLGFIAEEVEAVSPLLAEYGEKGELKGVKYRQMTAVLAKAMQEQQKEIEELKQRLESLEPDGK